MASRKGLLIVYTGNGKGKSTAAFGLVMRAWGRGMQVCVVQFVKSSTGKWGEVRAAKKMGIPWHITGEGFTWKSKDLNHSRALAEEGWNLARKCIASGEYDLVVLDEFTYPLKFGWLDTDQVLNFLAQRPAHVHVVVTGRDAPTALVEAADLVTEMRKIKHPYDRGLKAQPGIEF